MADKDPMHDLVTAYLTAKGKIEPGITVMTVTPRGGSVAYDVKLDFGGLETGYTSVYTNELLGWLWSHVATLVPKINQ
jgi:hypothetical protein